MAIVPITHFSDVLCIWAYINQIRRRELSKKWHRWLLDSELFGPVIQNREENRCISLRTKIAAITSMLLAGGTSIFLGVDDLRLRVLAVILICTGAVTVLSIKTCDSR
ncbi:MAG: DUF454 family protein [Candidatus Azotimanducaceae bacterium WSBS_2022_MAG_OTU7]